MDLPFTPITTLAELNQVLTASYERPLLLFNHSPTCSSGRRAYHDLAQVAYPITLVDVSRHHEVKWAIEDRTCVRHESPQVILVRNGQAVWSASHGRVTRQAVEAALREQGVRELVPAATAEREQQVAS